MSAASRRCLQTRPARFQGDEKETPTSRTGTKVFSTRYLKARQSVESRNERPKINIKTHRRSLILSPLYEILYEKK